jgi:hypothetical protein
MNNEQKECITKITGTYFEDLLLDWFPGHVFSGIALLDKSSQHVMAADCSTALMAMWKVGIVKPLGFDIAPSRAAFVGLHYPDSSTYASGAPNAGNACDYAWEVRITDRDMREYEIARARAIDLHSQPDQDEAETAEAGILAASSGPGKMTEYAAIDYMLSLAINTGLDPDDDDNHAILAESCVEYFDQSDDNIFEWADDAVERFRESASI